MNINTFIRYLLPIYYILLKSMLKQTISVIRYVFSSVDLEVCAPCYEYFSDLLSQNNNWCQVQQLDCNFSQYFQYNKSKELVIFKLTANHSM